MAFGPGTSQDIQKPKEDQKTDLVMPAAANTTAKPEENITASNQTTAQDNSALLSSLTLESPAPEDNISAKAISAITGTGQNAEAVHQDLASISSQPEEETSLFSWKGIKQGFNGFMESSGSYLSSAYESAVDKFDRITAPIMEKVESMGREIKRMSMSFTERIDDMMAEVNEIVEDFSNFAKNSWSRMVESFTGGFSAVGKMVGLIPDEPEDILTADATSMESITAPGTMYDAGVRALRAEQEQKAREENAVATFAPRDEEVKSIYALPPEEQLDGAEGRQEQLHEQTVAKVQGVKMAPNINLAIKNMAQGEALTLASTPLAATQLGQDLENAALRGPVSKAELENKIEKARGSLETAEEKAKKKDDTFVA